MPCRLGCANEDGVARALSNPSAVLALAIELIRRASVTPNDAGCQDVVAERLARHGFQVERWVCAGVDNLWLTYGQGPAHLLLLGHTDVVPPGAEENWTSPPFEPSMRDGLLYGRGAADMKSSVAAFVVALEDWATRGLAGLGRVSLLLTSDEEGPARHGVRSVIPHLQAAGQMPDAVLVGEPSSSRHLGDTIRIGRRGSIQARLKVLGEQSHTAYARGSDNPVHRSAALLKALTDLEFEDGDQVFPPTSLQISNLIASSGADNVTPRALELWFNIRHPPGSPAGVLEARIRRLIEQHHPGPHEFSWTISGAPFGPAAGPLLAAVQDACRRCLDRVPSGDTGGGTSDGRFFGPEGVEVVELGPVNASIHRVDEHIAVADLERLPGLYLEVIRRYLGAAGNGAGATLSG